MKNPFTTLFRALNKPRNTVNTVPTFYFGTSSSGNSVTVQTAIQFSTVYACVRVIAKTLTSLPFGMYEYSAEESSKAQDHPFYPLMLDKMAVERDKTVALFYAYLY